MVLTTPASSAARAANCASSKLPPRGFSQRTCLPACIRATAYGTCEAFGVQMCTTSALLSTTSEILPYACSTPQASATSRERAGLAAITPTIPAPAGTAARRCTSPIMPAPRIATCFAFAASMPERLVPSIRLLPATVQNDRVTAARILVVEDSNAIRVPVVTALSAQGFELASAADGSELERLLPSFAPDLVILQRCGESLDLTDSERRLLGYLAAHRDRVVSKTQILTIRTTTITLNAPTRVDGASLTLTVDAALVSEARRTLRRVLMITGVIALAVSAVLVAAAVRVALRPLDSMAALAKTISQGNRGYRLAPTRTDTELGQTAQAFDEMLDEL